MKTLTLAIFCVVILAAVTSTSAEEDKAKAMFEKFGGILSGIMDKSKGGAGGKGEDISSFFHKAVEKFKEVVGKDGKKFTDRLKKFEETETGKKGKQFREDLEKSFGDLMPKEGKAGGFMKKLKDMFPGKKSK